MVSPCVHFPSAAHLRIRKSIMALTLQNIVVNARGGKASILLRDGERFAHTFDLPVQAPFQPGNHDKDDTALRQNIVFRCNDEVDKFFGELDTWAVAYITEHSERLLGKELPAGQIETNYISSIKQSEGRPPLVKFKLNMPGSNKQTRCWDAEGNEIDFIRDWAGRDFKLRVLVSHMWLMGSCEKSEFGFVVLITDVLEKKTVHASPFTKPG